VRWREIGVRVTTSEMRGAAMNARAVSVLCRYQGFLALCGGQSQGRLKKRLSLLVIFFCGRSLARKGEKVGTGLGSRAEAGLTSGGE